MATDCTQITDTCEKIKCLFPELACDRICEIMPANGISATLKKEFNASTTSGDDTMTITTRAPIPEMSTYSFGNANCGVFAYGFYLERTNSNGVSTDSQGYCVENKNSDGTYTYVLSRLVKNLQPYGDACPYPDGEGDQSIHTQFETLTIGDPALHIWSRLNCNCIQSLASEVRQYYSSQAELYTTGNEPKHAGEIAVVPNGSRSVVIYAAVPDSSSSTGYDWATNYLITEAASTTNLGTVLLWKPLSSSSSPVVYNRGEYAPLDTLVDNLKISSGKVTFGDNVTIGNNILLKQTYSDPVVVTRSTQNCFYEDTFLISKESDVIISTNIIGKNALKTGYTTQYDAEVYYRIVINSSGSDITFFDVLAWPGNTNQNYTGKTKVHLQQGLYSIKTYIYMYTTPFGENTVKEVMHTIIGN